MEHTFVLTNFVLQIIGFAFIWHMVYYTVKFAWNLFYGDMWESNHTISEMFYKALLLIPYSFIFIFGALAIRILDSFSALFFTGFATTTFTQRYNEYKSGNRKDFQRELVYALHSCSYRLLPKPFYKDYNWGINDECKKLGMIDEKIEEGFFMDYPLFKDDILKTVDSHKIEVLDSLWKNAAIKEKVHATIYCLILIIAYTLLFTSVASSTIGFVLSPITDSMAQYPDVFGTYMSCHK